MRTVEHTPSVSVLREELALVEDMLEAGHYPSGLHRLRLLLRRLDHEALDRGTMPDDTVSGSANAGWNGNRVLSRALQVIRLDYRTATLASVAEELGGSEVYLSMLIKKRTGRTFKQYQVERRVEVARQLLRDPYHKVYEVADLVGYSDAKYFSRMFRDHTGMTPSEYRNRVD